MKRTLLVPLLVLGASVAGARDMRTDRFMDLHRLEEAPAATITEYFPAAIGDQWFYTDRVRGESFSIRVVGLETIRGEQAWKMERTREGGPSDFDLISVDDGSGARVHRRIVRGSVMDLEPAVRMTSGSPVAGEVLETEPALRNPVTGNTTRWRSEVTGFESRTTPAGTFDCVRVRLVIRDSRLATRFGDVLLWYGLGVGLVARRGHFFGQYFDEELTRRGDAASPPLATAGDRNGDRAAWRTPSRLLPAPIARR